MTENYHSSYCFIRRFTLKNIEVEDITEIFTKINKETQMIIFLFECEFKHEKNDYNKISRFNDWLDTVFMDFIDKHKATIIAVDKNSLLSKIFREPQKFEKNNVSNIIQLKNYKNQNISDLYSEFKRFFDRSSLSKAYFFSLGFGHENGILDGIKFSTKENIPFIQFSSNTFFKCSSKTREIRDELISVAKKQLHLFSNYSFNDEIRRGKFEKNILESIVKKKPVSYQKFNDNFKYFKFLKPSEISFKDLRKNASDEEIRCLLLHLIKHDKAEHCRIFFEEILTFNDNFLEDKHFEKLYNKLLLKKENDIYFPFSTSDSKYYKNEKEKLPEKLPILRLMYKSSNNFVKIFIQCIIFNLNETACVCWEYIENPIRYCLLAVQVYNLYAKKAENMPDLKDSYKNISKIWEEKAIKTLKFCYDYNKENTYKMLIVDFAKNNAASKKETFDKSQQTEDTKTNNLVDESQKTKNIKKGTKKQDWSISIISFASEVEAYDFLNARPCQEKITKIFHYRRFTKSFFKSPFFKFILYYVSKIRQKNMFIYFNIKYFFLFSDFLCLIFNLFCMVYPRRYELFYI